MKCLSLWQPWATFLAHHDENGRIKANETRRWSTDYRGPLLVHACARPVVKRVLDEWPFSVFRRLDYPRAAIVGRVDVVDCIPTEQWIAEHGNPATYGHSAPGQIYIEYLAGDYSSGRYAFVTENPVQFDHPVPHKSRQGKLLEVLTYIYRWKGGKGLRRKRAELFNRECLILKVMERNSAAVVWLDTGTMDVVDRRALRKV